MTLEDQSLAEFIQEFCPDPPPIVPHEPLADPAQDDIETFLAQMVVELQGLRGPRVPCLPLTQAALAVYQPRSPHRGVETARELLARGPYSLADILQAKVDDCPGVYALYYQGDLPVYSLLRDEASRCPLYLGSSQKVVQRLQQHTISSTQVGLGLENFTCRFLPLPIDCLRDCEGRVQNLYQTLWNTSVVGFGSRQYAVDQRAAVTTRSRWDTLHPGRLGAGGVARDEDVTASVEAAIPACLTRHRRVELLLAADEFLSRWDRSAK